jgi:soluble lytic murein transglycosylase
MRLEDIPKTLMAYNAGLSRLRGWERNFAGMPSDLLAEAAPYPETRNYIRKILVSAVYYGALYYERSLEQTVLLFFPGLGQP